MPPECQAQRPGPWKIPLQRDEMYFAHKIYLRPVQDEAKLYSQNSVLIMITNMYPYTLDKCVYTLRSQVAQW